MTKAQENEALNYAKELIQKKFTEQYGFAPSKKQIIPLEASYNHDKNLDLWFCDTLGFRIGNIGYSYTMGHPVTRNEVYDR